MFYVNSAARLPTARLVTHPLSIVRPDALLDLTTASWADFLVDELAATALRRDFEGFSRNTLDSIDLVAPSDTNRTAALRAGRQTHNGFTDKWRIEADLALRARASAATSSLAVRRSAAVPAWVSASTKPLRAPSGGTYGLRFGRVRSSVEGRLGLFALQRAGEKPISSRVTIGFWKQCPEVRAPGIR